MKPPHDTTMLAVGVALCAAVFAIVALVTIHTSASPAPKLITVAVER